MTSHRSHRAFTLIELLVVIMIVGLLVGLLLSAVQMSRAAARRAQCINNLKQYGIALHNYTSAYESFPPASSGSAYSPHVLLLPFMDQSPLYNSVNFSVVAGPDRQNSTLASANLATLMCPSDPYVVPRFSSGWPAMTNYAGNLGDDRDPIRPNGIFRLGGTVLADVPDGLSSTVAMSEFLVGRRGVEDRLRTQYNPNGGPPADRVQFMARCESLDAEVPNLNSLKGEVWVIGQRDYTLYNHVLPINQPSCSNTPGSGSPVSATTATSLHSGGANGLFADGHASFLRETIDPAVWSALGTRNGGEVVSSDSY